MPNRIVREGILTSERVDTLDWPAEVFYRRLLSKVDDHGLYDARPSILRSALFPLRVDRVREADCTRWIATCVKAGLIALYEHGGKPYLKVLNTQWQERSQPKYPIPPEGICEQLQTTVISCEPSSLSYSLSLSKTSKRPRKAAKRPLPEGFGISERVLQWATEKGHTQLPQRLEHFVGKAKANGYAYVDWDEAFMSAIRDDWAGLNAPRGNGMSKPQAAWWLSEATTEAKGRELGISAKPGESMQQYVGRIRAKLEEHRAA